MFEDCCVECGHLLSQQRNLCPFCGWRLQDDQYRDNRKSEYQLGHLPVEDLDTEKLSAPDAFQRIIL